MRESQIQSKKIKELEAQGYYVIKLVKTNKNGIPDLIAIPKNSDVLFVEVKSQNGKTSPLQDFRIEELEKHGLMKSNDDIHLEAISLAERLEKAILERDNLLNNFVERLEGYQKENRRMPTIEYCKEVILPSFDL